MKNAPIFVGVALVFSTLFLSSCSMQARHIVPTPAAVKQIGIPVYPNAKPWRASGVAQSSFLGGQEMLQVEFTTRDHMDVVERYYAAHVPSDAKRIALPLGFVNTVVFQWYDKNMLKQATIAEPNTKDSNGITLIQLQSTAFRLGRPTESTAPSASPS